MKMQEEMVNYFSLIDKEIGIENQDNTVLQRRKLIKNEIDLYLKAKKNARI